MEHIRNGLYALAVAIVASTIIFSWSLTSAAGTLGEGLAKGGVGTKVVAAAAGTATPAPAGTAAPTAAPTQAAPQPRGKLELADAPVRGSEGAQVVLVEYSDYQCPFCERFFTQTESQIIKDYVDTGKVKFVYKNFPLDSIHPQARPAAVAAECARKLDASKFWPYHDKLFQNIAALSADNYKKWAGELGLDKAKFDACVDAKETNPVVDAHFQEGAANGIQGTPGFLVTDATGNIKQEISGAQPYSVFKAALDQALAA